MVATTCNKGASIGSTPGRIQNQVRYPLYTQRHMVKDATISQRLKRTRCGPFQGTKPLPEMAKPGHGIETFIRSLQSHYITLRVICQPLNFKM